MDHRMRVLRQNDTLRQTNSDSSDTTSLHKILDGVSLVKPATTTVIYSRGIDESVAWGLANMPWRPRHFATGVLDSLIIFCLDDHPLLLSSKLLPVTSQFAKRHRALEFDPRFRSLLP
jgi:hypothetical protein